MTRNLVFAQAMLIVCLPWASMGDAQEESGGNDFKIGSYAAQLHAPENWRRRQFSADLGKDQFISGGNLLYAVVVEIESALESQEDFADIFNSILTGIDSKRKVTVMAVRLEDGLNRATQSFEATVGGLELFYHLSAVSRDGLSYTLMMWALQSHGDLVRQEAQALLAGIEFPGEGSDWQKLARPKLFRFATGSYELSFQARPSVFTNTPTKEMLINMSSPDDGNQIFAFETEDFELDELLTASLEATNDDFGEAPLEEVSRQDFRVGAAEARLMVCSNEDATFHLIAVETPDQRQIDIRYGTTGAPGRTRRDRELFLKTLDLRAIETAISFPELTEQAEPTSLNPFEQEVFKRAQAMAHTWVPFYGRCRRLDDGTFVALNDQEVVLVSGETNETLYNAGDWQKNLQLVQWNGRWLAATGNEDVLEISEGIAKPTDIDGRLIAATGDRLLTVLPTRGTQLLGMASVQQPGPDVLVQRTLDGTEREVVRLFDVRIEELVPSADGAHALLSCNSTAGPGAPSYRVERELVALDLASGERRTLDDWQQVDMLTAAGAGWLATGRPLAKPAGIYRLSSSGDVELLLSGSGVRGVAIVDDHLLFTSAYRAEPKPEAQTTIYRIGLGELAELGPKCHPFDGQTLNQIGSTALLAADGKLAQPATEPEIRKLLAAADEASQRLVGRKLPRLGFEIDALCGDVYEPQGLEPAGQLLVTLLMTTCLLDQGAIWVDTEASSRPDWLSPSTYSVSTPFAQGYTPRGLFTNVFYNDNLIWNPGTSIVAAALGRPLYVGLNPAEVEAAVRKADYPDANRIIVEGSAAQVVEMLESLRENQHFRAAAYEHLSALGRRDVLWETVKVFASAENALIMDKKIECVLRHDALDNAEAAAALAEDLMRAIEQHPREAVLYLLLGSAYERAQPDEPQLSRACYNRLLEVMSWGDVADAARARLTALDAQASVETTEE